MCISGVTVSAWFNTAYASDLDEGFLEQLFQIPPNLETHLQYLAIACSACAGTEVGEDVDSQLHKPPIQASNGFVYLPLLPLDDSGAGGNVLHSHACQKAPE